ncbi:M23 family metallopeptidase [Candidatus Parcubacteria bacterium]|nr:M23 family metallopeptidase [Candidatus Parcubacteria bacterium]
MSALFFILFFLFSPLVIGTSPLLVRAENTAQSRASQTVALLTSPSTIRNGDAVLFELRGKFLSDVLSGTFLGNKIDFFVYKNRTIALLPVDFSKKAGTYDAKVVFKDGTEIVQKVTVESRTKQVEKLGIPEKLGGNSATSTAHLVTELDRENAELNVVYRFAHKAYWTNSFVPPVLNSFVTDGYGIVRDTNGTSLTHKGADYRAAIGTPVYAVNRGVVRVSKYFNAYGNGIIVDHGLGLHTIYLHLSKRFVMPGQLVLPGQLIGLAGDTGYAEAAHLHISIKIDGISIDPVEFFGLFK